ncbi:putative ATP-dependent peptidase [Proteiniborus sp. DW1]|uniref:ATP-dependent zinc metalloprotease FtsH n=1 Tax=Proteiniborus sp. DW1 TaxID=1889883 RepID=UPI00092E0730|nr:ATP-dependent zinc metalloprotease FtsH [Proteiniborus sp. DW1]SCG82635.1 putative ATP-dependent peptidase [Proteiniborus sp. DW1]
MKKKLTFIIVIICLSISTFLVYEKYFSSINLSNITNGDRFFIWIVTLIVLVYYLRLDSKPSLVPASFSSEKKKGEDSTNENNKPEISFKDVAGLDEIKEELQEITDFINNSEKYTKMGAKIPRGVLFYGPPGTGKTLLAKALAGETKSTFLYASGSEFVEKYVGVGAKRVRTLFEKAKKEAPSIVFIDEIDAIGSRRNSDSNNEKDQTLNQLLVEMDGFYRSQTVIVIGATNRLDLLDEALLRPGRFDRHIYVGNPNVKARKEIFGVHTKDKPLDASINIEDLAKKTHGFSGAQLANIANEAAIIAVRNKKKVIDINDFNSAIERVVAGLEVKNPTVLDKEKNIVSYHEAGHALVGKLLNVDMIQKISIVPRGQALGYVLRMPDEERYLLTEKELLDKIKVLLAGRAAEFAIFGEITTGAKDDLIKATEIAQEMVCSYGMSSLGNIAIKEQYIKYSFNKVDREIKKIINSCYEDALQLINLNKNILRIISEYLLENETMTGEELDYIFDQYNNSHVVAT